VQGSDKVSLGSAASEDARLGRLIDAIRVMAGLVPAIHAVKWRKCFKTRSLLLQPRALCFETCAVHAGVDGRDKPGHDGTIWFS
jgi:hypothetical protein